jgi:hypothetical protein
LGLAVTRVDGKWRINYRGGTTMTPWEWLGQWRWHGGSNDQFEATLGCGTGLQKRKAMSMGNRSITHGEPVVAALAAFCQQPFPEKKNSRKDGASRCSTGLDRARPASSEWPLRT